MKEYIAFLRGINISGKNKIAMPELKASFEAAGFGNVSTYLNSGNVLFTTDEENIREIIENMIYDTFGLSIPVYVIEAEALKDILQNSPEWWNTGDKDKYDNMIFILSSDTPEKVSELIGEPSEELEVIWN